MQTVYIVMKNADFTEGRGPFIFQKAFVTVSALKEWCNNLQHGIFGWEPPKELTFFDALWEGRYINNTYTPSAYGGWEGYHIIVAEAE